MNNLDVCHTIWLEYGWALRKANCYSLFSDPVTETVIFQLEAKVVRSDLIGFGFSPYGEAENADLVVMWTNSDGKHMFQVG